MTWVLSAFAAVFVFAIGYYVKKELDYARESTQKFDELMRRTKEIKEKQAAIMAEKRSVDDAAKHLDDGSF